MNDHKRQLKEENDLRIQFQIISEESKD